MRLRIGYELIYECPKPTPMILTLNVHFSRASDLVVPDYLLTDPSLPIQAYRDLFGNWCTRGVAPTGRTRFFTDARINDTGRADLVVQGAGQTPVEALPEETLVFLLGSRYCETDRLSPIAWPLFAAAPLGWGVSKPSATSCTTTSPSGTRTPGRPRRPGKLTKNERGSVATLRTLRSRFAGA